MLIFVYFILFFSFLCSTNLHCNQDHNAPQSHAQKLFYASDYQSAWHAFNQEINNMEQDGISESHAYHLKHIMRGQCALSLGVDAYFAGDITAAREWFALYWQDFEHKIAIENKYDVPLWQPGESIDNKTVCVIAGIGSDGFGDTGAFIQWVAECIKNGAKKVTLYLDNHSLLESLLSEKETLNKLGIDEIRTRKKGPLPEADLYVPLMNLPARINASGLGSTTPDTVPLYSERYIFPNVHAVAAWKVFMQQTTPQGIVPITFNHSASAKPTAGGVCPIDRTVPCSELVQSMVLHNAARLYFVGGSDHYPIRQSEYEKLKKEQKLGTLDIHDTVPDDFEVLIAQHADPQNLASAIIAKKDAHSGPASDKKIYIVKDAQPFVDAQAVHHCCDESGGVTITADTATGNFAGAGNYTTHLLLKKGQYRGRRWGTKPEKTWLFNSVNIIGEQQDGLKGMFERVSEVIKSTVRNAAMGND